MRIEFNRTAIRELMRNEDLVDGRAKAIADACNEESSWDDDGGWGGYGSATSTSEIRARARVWCAKATPERANRMIRHLDAE